MRFPRSLASVAVAAAALLLGASSALVGVCGPFTDVAADAFCPFVLEIFTLGITTGTSPTTYDPTSPVNRLQMAAFLSRSVDGVLKRGSRRAALDQFWTTPNEITGPTLTTVGDNPLFIKSDGADLWVTKNPPGSVARVRASDGRLLDNWTGATSAFGVLPAMGMVFAAGATNPGSLYRIDPSQPAGLVTTLASNLGASSKQMAFDGARIWTANSNSVSLATPGVSIPWSVTTVTNGFTSPAGLVYDGGNIWVTESVAAGRIHKLDSSGTILQTVTVGAFPEIPAFDGTNIWVPNSGNPPSVSVVRASSGAVIATLTGNGLSGPLAVAFDGQRILATNYSTATVSLWKAADLTPVGYFVIVPVFPYGVCSDGITFWIANAAGNQIARF